jgi:hypothetical protein
MRLFFRSSHRPSPHDLELELHDTEVIHLDHFCPSSDMRRLLGIRLTDVERAALVDGQLVAVPASCDRCLWERRLLLRLAQWSGDARRVRS